MNRDGAVLCPAGFVLTDAAILRLQNAGVDMVFVDAPGDVGPGPEERLAALEDRFSGVKDPTLLKLKHVIHAHLSELIAAAGKTAT